MSALAIVNLVVFTALLSFLYQLSKKELGLSRLVLVGLVLGTLFGTYLQVVFGPGHQVSQETIEWTNVVANGFVNLHICGDFFHNFFVNARRHFRPIIYERNRISPATSFC